MNKEVVTKLQKELRFYFEYGGYKTVTKENCVEIKCPHNYVDDITEMIVNKICDIKILEVKELHTEKPIVNWDNTVVDTCIVLVETTSQERKEKQMTIEKEEILEELKDMYEKLDNIQEKDACQKDEELMWEIGEAMGSIDNAIDVLEK